MWKITLFAPVQGNPAPPSPPAAEANFLFIWWRGEGGMFFMIYSLHSRHDRAMSVNHNCLMNLMIHTVNTVYCTVYSLYICCTRWVPAETGKYFSKKRRKIEGSSFLSFSSLGPSRIGRTVRLALYITKALANCSLEVLPRGRHRPFLNFKRVNISSANSLFWLGQM
jgi:hypothetical protein